MDKKLNQYLSEMSGYLSDVPAADRARIVLEVEDKIKEATKSHNIDQVLEDLGSALLLANHYRLSRNLETIHIKKPVSIFKWFFSLMLFFFFTSLIAGGIIVWKFTPVFKVDEEKNRVILLGGLIDINGTSGRIKMMDQYHYVDNQFANSFDGSIEINNQEFDELVLNYKSGVVDITNSKDNHLSWDCKLDSPPKDEFINKSKGIIEFDLEELEGIACNIQIPANLKLTIDAKDSKVSVIEPEYDVFIELNNGTINFNPNPELEYKFDIELENGIRPQFKSSESPDAFEVKLSLENGTITNLQ